MATNLLSGGPQLKRENDEKVRFLVSYQTKECEKYHVLGK